MATGWLCPVAHASEGVRAAGDWQRAFTGGATRAPRRDREEGRRGVFVRARDRGGLLEDGIRASSLQQRPAGPCEPRASLSASFLPSRWLPRWGRAAHRALSRKPAPTPTRPRAPPVRPAVDRVIPTPASRPAAPSLPARRPAGPSVRKSMRERRARTIRSRSGSARRRDPPPSPGGGRVGPRCSACAGARVGAEAARRRTARNAPWRKAGRRLHSRRKCRPI